MLEAIPISLLGLHFLGDFLLQSDWMALNKSKSWLALYLHVLVYSLCFLPFGMAFVGITFLLHFLTDAITSRITSRLWFIEHLPMGDGLIKVLRSTYGYEVNPFVASFNNKRHWFFVVIGLDQLIHFACLALAYSLTFGLT